MSRSSSAIAECHALRSANEEYKICEDSPWICTMLPMFSLKSRHHASPGARSANSTFSPRANFALTKASFGFEGELGAVKCPSSDVPPANGTRGMAKRPASYSQRYQRRARTKGSNLETGWSSGSATTHFDDLNDIGGGSWIEYSSRNRAGRVISGKTQT